jgi:5-formyltetrahydrofolate cyclo-ligase
MSGAIREQKEALRHELRARTRSVSEADRARASEQICLRLKGQPRWQQARIVLLYVPAKFEPDVWPLAGEAVMAGKIVCLPRYVAVQDDYEICAVRDPLRELVPGPFGLREPQAGCEIFDVNRLDFSVVPGIGFDLGGWRLGRGKGYYDRLLARVPGFKCGIGFDWQVVNDLPVEPHDVRLNCILTPTLWQEVAGQARF